MLCIVIFSCVLSFAHRMLADLENFEIEHIDDEDFENRHIAIEAMIRAP